MIQLPPDFKEFLKLLNATSVDYLVVGGYAVGLHGHVRATGDLDIWLRASDETASKIRQVLVDFGFTQDALPADFGSRPRQMVRMGFPPLQLEIMTTISGVQFEDVFSRRMVVDIEGLAVNVIGLEDLKKNKKATGRLKDLADVEELGP